MKLSHLLMKSIAALGHSKCSRTNLSIFLDELMKHIEHCKQTYKKDETLVWLLKNFFMIPVLVIFISNMEFHDTSYTFYNISIRPLYYNNVTDVLVVYYFHTYSELYATFDVVSSLFTKKI